MCRYVNPALCKELGPRVNTEACEQSFAWLARSKHIFRRMNQVPPRDLGRDLAEI